MVSGLELSTYQIFSNNQLERYGNNEIFSDYCFINCMDEDIIEFAREIIKDDYHLNI
jgi:hypothetical protein